MISIEFNSLSWISEIIYAMKQLAKTNGIALAPEAAATYAAVKQLKNDGWLDRDEITLLLCRCTCYSR